MKKKHKIDWKGFFQEYYQAVLEHKPLLICWIAYFSFAFTLPFTPIWYFILFFILFTFATSHYEKKYKIKERLQKHKHEITTKSIRLEIPKGQWEK